ncbi:M20/M25/M40 family metallo-hydrolase [Negativicoccus succinicivorans]|uniref:M20/M25/M40 family metallo-hydrolase n=1 Tax=Negativicoccus succinicivorans TaxID=620903 RepID=UPI0028FFEFD7|nr:M20/M25/M40 family metallo-hydrolase [Negativicoccus succinicivorans]MDU2417677.1 M20/M25/M40 family metallo-hydrolase [Negativicoccus succinicivorans]
MNVNKERMLNEFYELIRIPCSTGDEREVADLLKKRLKKLGAQDVKEDDAGSKINGNAGNIIATFGATMEGLPTVAFTAHMDCVEPCAGIEPVLKDGVITSKGDTILGGDDKSGVAAILEGLRLMKENALPHGKIVIIFCVAEEGGLRGSRNIDTELTQGIDFGYVLDSSGAPGKIINQAPGQNAIRVTMHGKRSHAGLAPEDGVNAIVMMGTALARLPYGRIDEETTANVGFIDGGIATNIVADKCSVKAEARSRDLAKLKQQTDAMKEAFMSVEKDFPGGKAEVEVEEIYQPYLVDENSLCIEVAKRAAKEAGLEPNVGATGGGSDANNFNKHSFPAAVLATGMTKVHTPEECLLEEHLYQTGEWVYRIIEQLPHAHH